MLLNIFRNAMIVITKAGKGETTAIIDVKYYIVKANEKL